MTEYLNRTCPCCQSNSTQNIEIHSKIPAETLVYEILVPIWNGFFKEKSFFSYVRCKTCGMLFAPTFFKPDQLAALHKQMAPNMEVVPTDMLRKTQSGYYEVLKRHCAQTGDYLELGPDIGLFTENCVDECNFGYYWLFEPNRSVEAELTRAMRDKSHKIIFDMFGFAAVPEKTIGAVVMVHVLDHLLDPVATLTELRSKMTPDGTLLIVTHNEMSLLPRLIRARWPAFCLQHPQLYNPQSISALMSAAGFEVKEIARSVNYFPLGFLLRHLLWALGLKVKSVPSFGGASLGLRLGNIVTVATPARS